MHDVLPSRRRYGSSSSIKSRSAGSVWLPRDSYADARGDGAFQALDRRSDRYCRKRDVYLRRSQWRQSYACDRKVRPVVFAPPWRTACCTTRPSGFGIRVRCFVMSARRKVGTGSSIRSVSRPMAWPAPISTPSLSSITARIWQALGIPGLELQINTLGTAAESVSPTARAVGRLFRIADADILDEDSRRRLGHNPLRILDSKNPDMREHAGCRRRR